MKDLEPGLVDDIEHGHCTNPATRARAVWELGRPRTCLVGVLTFAIAVELVGTAWTWQVWLGVLVSALVPLVANLHNALSDLAEDSRNLPGRLRLVQDAGPTTLKRLVAGLLLIILACCAAGHVVALVLAFLGGLLLLSYSAPPVRAKARPVLGLVVFSLVVAVPYLAGALASDSWSQLGDFQRHGALWLAPYFFVWFVAKGMVKNVPDFHGDKAAGLRTSATVCRDIRSAGFVASCATVLVYSLYPVAVWVSGAPPAMFAAAVWCPVAMGHSILFVRDESPMALNAALKRDMVITVIFLVLILLTVSQSTSARVTAVAALISIFAVDLLRADSRESRYLRIPDSPKEARL